MALRKLVIVTAPSGAGKTSLARRLLEAIPEMRFAVSVTTRAPRPQERHGVDYFFVSTREFRRLIETGALVEYEEVYPGCLYGTLRTEVEGDGPPVLLDLDVKGAARLRRLRDGYAIFVAPPSMAVLSDRLAARSTESASALRMRMQKATEEMTYSDRFDAIVRQRQFGASQPGGGSPCNRILAVMSIPFDLQGRRILLGVTGSIAAYKACELIRQLRRRGLK